MIPADLRNAFACVTNPCGAICKNRCAQQEITMRPVASSYKAVGEDDCNDYLEIPGFEAAAALCPRVNSRQMKSHQQAATASPRPSRITLKMVPSAQPVLPQPTPETPADDWFLPPTVAPKATPTVPITSCRAQETDSLLTQPSLVSTSDGSLSLTSSEGTSPCGGSSAGASPKSDKTVWHGWSSGGASGAGQFDFGLDELSVSFYHANHAANHHTWPQAGEPDRAAANRLSLPTNITMHK